MKEKARNTHTVVQIYYDNDGGLVSSIRINNKEKALNQRDTKRLLKELDKESYDAVNLTSDSIRLKADDALVVIYDLRDMLRNDAFTLLPNTFPQIQEEISKYNRRIAQNRKRKNIRRGRRRFAITALVLVLLSATALGYVYDKNNIKGSKGGNKLDFFDNPNSSSSIENIIGKIESSSDVTIDDEIIFDIPSPSDEDLDKTIPELEDYVPENATYVDFRFTDDLEKKNYAYDNFYPIVEEEATKYGISPNLPMAMLTQESGGMEDNLMQIEFDQWKDMKLNIYNFNENKYDYFVLTDNPELYEGTKYTTISRNDLLDPRINIMMGCAITRKSAEMVNYHILAGVQCYNLGAGNMETVLAETARNTGQDVRDILSDQTNTTFVDYTHIPGVGDKDYLSHVFQFLDEEGSVITFKHLDGEGNIITEEITLFSQANKGLN